MSTSKRIAVAGAGSLGVPVIQALVYASYPVTILTRSTTPKNLDLAVNADVKYVTVDYKSVQSLANALQGHFGVVSTVTATSTGEQGPLIEAAAEAGIKRFIPAEFGADMMNPNTRALAVFQYKAATEEKVAELAAANPNFTYSLIMNGIFLDWGLQMAFLLDVKNRSITLFDGGESKFSTTTLATVAKAVVSVFENLEKTENRAVYIHDAVVTQKQLLEMAKRADPEKKPWDLKTATTAETRDNAMQTLAGNPTPEELGGAMVNLLYPSVLAEGYGGDFSGRTDNALLGLKGMSDEELGRVVATYL